MSKHSIATSPSSSSLTVPSFLSFEIYKRFYFILRTYLLERLLPHFPFLSSVFSLFIDPSTSTSILTKHRLRWILSFFLSFLCFKKWLLPWIAQSILKASQLTLVQLDMSHPTLTQLTLHMISKLSRTGPLPIQLRFTSPVQTLFQKKMVGLAHINDTVQIPPNGGEVIIPANLVLEKKNGTSFASQFGEFAKQLVLSEDMVSFDLLCPKGIQVTLFHGLLKIPRLTLHKHVQLQGMQGLRSIQVVSVLLQSASAKDMTLKCECLIDNPSNVHLALGSTQFKVYLESPDTSVYPDQAWIGDLVIDHLDLLACTTTSVTALCHVPRPSLESPNYESLLDVLSNYLSFQSTQVRIVGQSSPFPYLTSALEALQVTTTLPPLNLPMVQSTSIAMSQTNVFARTVQSYLYLNNPFPLPLTLHRVHGVATLALSLGAQALQENGSPIVVGRIEDAHVAMYVPKLTSLKIEDPVTLDIELGLSQLKAIVTSGGTMLVDLEMELDCRLGKCVLNGIKYKQCDVPVYIDLF